METQNPLCHITANLAQPRRRDLFLEILEQARQRCQFVVVGYVVMPEHIHLLINAVKRGLVLEPDQWPWSSDKFGDIHDK